ncbi:MAG: rRNA pseudouridine synthase [Lactobacillaceae bacterium]|jgi:23S rRNA pseudouridine2605 synthase|nr:rRNA pseudouridine synthase [Lactobacillaceae bacterium]
MSERLQKLIANAGVASRRKAEEMIKGGRVSVNGQVVRELGMKAEVTDQIKVDGKLIGEEQKEYYVLNKPKGYTSSTKSFKDQKAVVNLINTNARIYPVGRLDIDTTGVLVLTNDGEMTNRLTHPSHEVNKTYKATVKGEIGDEIQVLSEPMIIDGETYASAEYQILKNGSTSVVEITIHEGKNHEVKNIMNYIGHPVLELDRTEFAKINHTGISQGQYRKLTEQEIRRLKK